MAEKRLDITLVEMGLSSSRERAKEMIKLGQVIINGHQIIKPSRIIYADDKLEIVGETLKYVGRGGLKLEYALDRFNIDIKESICLDIGASTGGFTDCMLQNGVRKVYAVDVGHSQLADSLRDNPKVVNMEKQISEPLVNSILTRILTLLPSMFLLYPSNLFYLKYLRYLMTDSMIALIKPQFEAGRQNLNKHGIVLNPKVHISVLEEIYFFKRVRILSKDLCCSPIRVEREY